VRPATLYKYLSPERTDVLQNLRIRFTQVSALNDPFESYPGVLIGEREWYLSVFRGRIEDEMEKLGIRGEGKRKQYWRARKKDFDHFHKCYTDVNWLLEQSELVQRMSDTVHGCLSLSAICTNILMWSHYAQHHRGLVIGFDAEHEYFGRSVDPVVYSTSRQPHNPSEHQHSGDLFYAKSTDWAYEQEYRKFQSFVEPIKLANGNDLLPFPKRGPSVRPNEAIVLFPIPAEAIQCVILGWKSSPTLHNEVAEALNANQLAHVPIRKARPSLTKFEMEVSPQQAT
jgi:hypothetical protein